jgi:hypothetical protein
VLASFPVGGAAWHLASIFLLVTRFRFFALWLPFSSTIVGLRFFSRWCTLVGSSVPAREPSAQFLLPVFFVRSCFLCAVGICWSWFSSLLICVCNRIRKPILSLMQNPLALCVLPQVFGKKTLALCMLSEVTLWLSSGSKILVLPRSAGNWFLFLSCFELILLQCSCLISAYTDLYFHSDFSFLIWFWWLIFF